MLNPPFKRSVENLSRVCSNNASPAVRRILDFLLFPCFRRFQLRPVFWEFLSGVQSRGTRYRQQHLCEFSDGCSPGNSPICGPGSWEPSFLHETLCPGWTLAGRDRLLTTATSSQFKDVQSFCTLTCCSMPSAVTRKRVLLKSEHRSLWMTAGLTSLISGIASRNHWHLLSSEEREIFHPCPTSYLVY